MIRSETPRDGVPRRGRSALPSHGVPEAGGELGRAVPQAKLIEFLRNEIEGVERLQGLHFAGSIPGNLPRWGDDGGKDPRRFERGLDGRRAVANGGQGDDLGEAWERLFFCERRRGGDAQMKGRGRVGAGFAGLGGNVGRGGTLEGEVLSLGYRFRPRLFSQGMSQALPGLAFGEVFQESDGVLALGAGGAAAVGFELERSGGFPESEGRFYRLIVQSSDLCGQFKIACGQGFCLGAVDASALEQFAPPGQRVSVEARPPSPPLEKRSQLIRRHGPSMRLECRGATHCPWLEFHSRPNPSCPLCLSI
jgi:hypothetical protein